MARQGVGLIGLGSIGISFAALHLRRTKVNVRVFDTRPDLNEHLQSVLPGYLDTTDPSFSVSNLIDSGRLKLCTTLEEACQDVSIVQEQGPENPAFKQSIWPKIEKAAPLDAHFWSSTSGIEASKQSVHMKDRSRLLVVHPFNPPHILPLIEIVPSPTTKPEEVEFARSYFTALGRRPVTINKEIPGFVGNRLAFFLLREAVYLVQQGVISVEDLDTLMEASLGPRWAIQGPFKSYNMGGGAGGMEAWLKNLTGTIQDVWDSTGDLDAGWVESIGRKTNDAYGKPNPEQYAIRDKGLQEVLKVQEDAQTKGA